MSDRPRVLFVVDDNQDVLSTFDVIFGRNGYEVQTFATGQAFVDSIQSGLPDVAVIDLNLPEMNGIDLAQSIRKRPDAAEVVLVGVSGDNREATHQTCLECGFDLFFAKPFRLRVVCDEVTRFLDSRT